MAAISAAAAIGAVASAGNFISGLMSSDAASSAADAQVQSGQAAIDERQREFNQIQANSQPWINTGTQALSKLKSLLLGTTYNQDWKTANDAYLAAYNQYMDLSRQPWSVARDRQMQQLALQIPKLQSAVTGLNPADYNGVGGYAPGSLLKPFTGADLVNEPGYQFGMSEGEKGINRSMAARGAFDSGAALKALSRFDQDYAGTKYDAAFNRDAAQKSQVFNMLSGLAGTGQTAQTGVNSAGLATSGATADLLTGQGNATAGGIVGSANAIGSGVSGAVNSLQTSLLLSKLLAGGGSGNYGTSGTLGMLNQIGSGQWG